MAYELIYTSVPQGIKSGSSGFCTVAYTQGLAANIALKLEGMSAYKPYFPHYDSNAVKNPVSFSHYSTVVSGETLHFLSRVCFYGLDYTKRSNKLAHHYVLRNDEVSLIKAGPAAVCEDNTLFVTEWNQPPQLFRQQKMLRNPLVQPGKASCWELYTGDAGWAGTLVQHYLDTAGTKPVWIIFDPLIHTNILRLVSEALKLLPEKQRWDVCFSTYFVNLPAGMNCHWRFCTPDSEALKDARKLPNNLIIDLTNPLGPAGNGELENRARTGALPPPPPRQQMPQQMPQQQMPQTAQSSRGVRVGPQIFRKMTPPEHPVLPPAAQNSQMPPPGSGERKMFKAAERKSTWQTLMPIIIVLLLLVIGVLVTALFMMYKDSGVPEISSQERISAADTPEPVTTAGSKEKSGKKARKKSSKERKKKKPLVPEGVEMLKKLTGDNPSASRKDINSDAVSGKKKSVRSDAAFKKDKERNSDAVSGKKKSARSDSSLVNAESGSTAPALKSKVSNEQIVKNCNTLFLKNLSIRNSLNRSGGETILEDVLYPGEKIKKARISFKDSRDSREIDVDIRENKLIGQDQRHDLERGLVDIKLCEYTLAYENGNIVLQESSGNFKKRDLEIINLVTTRKNREIWVRFSPRHSRWPEDLKDGVAQFRADMKSMRIFCTYELTELDTKTAMLATDDKESEIIVKCGKIVFNGDIVKGKFNGVYYHRNNEKARRQKKELEAIAKYLEKPRNGKNKTEFDKLVNTLTDKKEKIFNISLKKFYEGCKDNKELKRSEHFEASSWWKQDKSLNELLVPLNKAIQEDEAAFRSCFAQIKNGKIALFRGGKLLKYVNYGEKSK